MKERDKLTSKLWIGKLKECVGGNREKYSERGGCGQRHICVSQPESILGERKQSLVAQKSGH